MNFDQRTLIIVFVALFAIWILWPSSEGFEFFDAGGNEFLPVGSVRYGLRGEPLRTSSIAKYYISPRRQIRLSQTMNPMYEANLPPAQMGEKGCQKVDCPKCGAYDKTDTCWTCANFPAKPMTIPDMAPHVPN